MSKRVTLVTPDDVFELEPQKVGIVHGCEQHAFDVRVFRAGKRIGVIRITATSMALNHASAQNAFSERLSETLVDLARPYVLRGTYSCDIRISLDNISALLRKRHISDEEREYQVARVLYRHFYEFRAKPALHQTIVLSTGFSSEEVTRACGYLSMKGCIAELPQGQGFTVGPNGIKELEALIQRGQAKRFPPQGYFHEVELAADFDYPFILVLMPFDNKYLNNLIPRIIKPTIERVTGIRCYNASEHQRQLQITDQIFTLIVRADAIVAEITDLNANVLIEIGVALANNKQVYIFYDSKRLPHVPFYLSKIPWNSYSTEAEFIHELEKVHI